MKKILSDKEIIDILTAMDKILRQHSELSFQKKMKLFCYYTNKAATKKLIFYLNPRHTEVVFGISHRGTDILEKYPMLPSLADETKVSVMKFSIKKIEEIEKKAINKLIELILQRHIQ